MEAVVRVGQVGLGYWGKNLVRNFDDLAQLTWLCDAEEANRAEFAQTLVLRIPIAERAKPHVFATVSCVALQPDRRRGHLLRQQHGQLASPCL